MKLLSHQPVLDRRRVQPARTSSVESSAAPVSDRARKALTANPDGLTYGLLWERVQRGGPANKHALKSFLGKARERKEVVFDEKTHLYALTALQRRPEPTSAPAAVRRATPAKPPLYPRKPRAKKNPAGNGASGVKVATASSPQQLELT